MFSEMSLRVLATFVAMVTRSRWLFFFSIVLRCLARTSLCVGDTIASGESLSRDQTLTSKGNVFELGFFSTNDSTNIYLGIWYKNAWEKVTIWVANRDKPLSDVSSSHLILSEEGNLHLMNSKIQVWSTNLTSKPGNSTVAVLLDDGNLVLRDGYKSSGFLWQSFDYPSGDLVPGAKLGFNKLTKASQVLTTWKTYQDPGKGMFSLGIDQDRSQIYLEWNKSQRYWTSGPWNGHFFSQLPEMNDRRKKEIFNFSFVSNENETFFTFSVNDTSKLTMLTVDAGELMLYTWLKGVSQKHVNWARPTNKCEIYGVCGAFSSCLRQDTISCACLDGFEPHFQPNGGLRDWYKGCVRRTPLQCENKTSGTGQEDDFILQSNIRLPGNAQTLTVGGDQQCKLACLNYCSCTAYTYANGQCSIWYGELFNMQKLNDSQGSDFYVKLAPSELPRIKAKAKKPLRLIIALPTVLAMLIFCFFLCNLRKRRLKKRGESERSQDLLLFDFGTSNKANDCNYSDISRLQKEHNQRAKLPLFSFSSVSTATDNFSIANKLGEGGFGPVYKGTLKDGHEVAVKRLSRQSRQGLIEFRNEMLLIAQLQHRNLVGLLGCCVERDEKILIYEYMPNKSLDSILFVQKNVADPTRPRLLDWERRIHIISGIAQGLIYLHDYSRLRIIHRDLKASNILLDGDMNPKISDFGMARIFGGNNSQANTNRIVGTYGYMSPEYAMVGLFSVKSDVFSFGVLMIEILSGKKNTSFYHPETLYLLGYAWELWKIGRGLELIDPALSDPPSTPLTLRYIQVALLCVQESPSDRPTMPEVFSMLSNESAALPLPKEPAFSIGRREAITVSPMDGPKNISMNDVTITMEAR